MDHSLGLRFHLRREESLVVKPQLKVPNGHLSVCQELAGGEDVCLNACLNKTVLPDLRNADTKGTSLAL